MTHKSPDTVSRYRGSVSGFYPRYLTHLSTVSGLFKPNPTVSGLSRYRGLRSTVSGRLVRAREGGPSAFSEAAL
jgi:hypothetical protein